MQISAHLLPAVAAFAALASALFSPLAQAQAIAPHAEGEDPVGKPRWEAGLAAGAARVSDYPGADQRHGRGVVLPVFIYRGPILRVDQGGIRGRVFGSPDWELDLTATAAFNARNNDARQGMPDLDYLFGMGPQLVYKGLRHLVGAPTLHLKTRAVMSTDFDRFDDRGVTFDPEVRWRFGGVAGSRAALTLFVQPTWASKPLHRYFYQVDASQATTTRPAYEAKAGYLGTELGATLSRRHGDSLSWFASARLLSLHGAANADSPLLRDKSNVNVGVGVVWTPWQSRVRVVD